MVVMTMSRSAAMVLRGPGKGRNASMGLAEKLVLFAFAVVAAMSLVALLPSSAQENATPRRTIALTAVGQVAATPDKVDISTGVTSQAPTAKAALDKNSEAMTGVVAALKDEGIDAKDIQTSDFSVSPIYEQSKDGTRAPEIAGYQVTNSVRITVRDTKKLGPILDKIVSLGANQIGAIEFGISEEEPLKDEARRRAMQQALANAKLYAEAANANLGNVLTIAEEQGMVIPRAAARPMAMKADVPIESGTAMVEVRVNVTYELK
jgi:uncharacterized protein YggE